MLKSSDSALQIQQDGQEIFQSLLFLNGKYILSHICTQSQPFLNAGGSVFLFLSTSKYFMTDYSLDDTQVSLSTFLSIKCCPKNKKIQYDVFRLVAKIV